MSEHHAGACGGLLQAYPINHYLPGISSHVGIGEALFGIAYFCNAAVMLFWIYIQRKRALQGIDGAALYAIFPVYIPFMYMSFFSDVAVGLLLLFVPIDYSGPNNWTMAISAALVYALQHFVLEGIAFTMMQYGCGYQAAYRAGLYALLWGILTFLDQLSVRKEGPTRTAYAIDMLWNLILLVFYMSLWLLPEKILFRRPSVMFYAKFWSIFRLLDIIGISLVVFWSNATDGAGYCTFAFGNMIIFVVCKPYVIYRTLLADSIWWQGLGQQTQIDKLSVSSEDSGSNSMNSNSNSNNSGSKGNNNHNHNNNNNHALDGKDINTETMSPMVTAAMEAVASTEIGQAGYLSSILPFSSPSSNTKYSMDRKRLTSGTYRRRTYRALSNPLLGMEVGFTEAQELAQEVDNLRTGGDVRLLNFAYLSLKKSSPVLGSGSFSKVYAGEYRGKSVAIKMLFTPDLNPEVIRRCCNEAQLLSRIRHENIVTIYGVAVLPPSVCIVLEKCEYGSLADVLRGSEPSSGGNVKVKEALPLTHADRMYLALGCCRGVAAMHQFSSSFVHRDIKSFNFLVDSQLVVKVADLELGSSSTNNSQSAFNNNNVHDVEANPSFYTNLNANGNGNNPLNAPKSDIMAFRSSMMMSSWQAPEVISGEEYYQAADVYSLCMVLWEIIAPSNMHSYSSSNNSSHHSLSGRDPHSHMNNGLAYSQNHSHGNNFTPSARPSASALIAAFKSSTYNNHNSSWTQLPFGDCQTQKEVRSKILAGERPPIPKGFHSKYVELIERGWQQMPQLRPSAQEAVIITEQCWLDCVYRHIKETAYLVDLSAIQEAYYRNSNNNNVSDERYSTNVEDYDPSYDPSNNQNINNINNSINTSSNNNNSSYRSRAYSFTSRITSRAAALLPPKAAAVLLGTAEKNQHLQTPAGRRPPSPAVLSALSVMQLDENWLSLDEEGAFVIVAASAPYLILWATRSWCKVTGYLLNEVLAYDLSIIEGKSSDRSLLQQLLESASKGTAKHGVIKHYRKDGSSFFNSIHVTPIYSSLNHTDTTDSIDSNTQISPSHETNSNRDSIRLSYINMASTIPFSNTNPSVPVDNTNGSTEIRESEVQTDTSVCDPEEEMDYYPEDGTIYPLLSDTTNMSGMNSLNGSMTTTGRGSLSSSYMKSSTRSPSQSLSQHQSSTLPSSPKGSISQFLGSFRYSSNVNSNSNSNSLSTPSSSRTTNASSVSSQSLLSSLRNSAGNGIASVLSMASSHRDSDCLNSNPSKPIKPVAYIALQFSVMKNMRS